MKNLFLKFSWLPVLFLLSSCWQEPDYPDEPQIEFSSITQTVTKDEFNQAVIQVVLAIKFKDGDGNLGLNSEELDPPYNPVPGNKFQNNFFVDAFLKIPGGEFAPYTPGISYNGRFLRLNPDSKSLPIEGELRYTFNINPGFDLNSGDQLKFNLQIADRALNLSNTVQTDPITLSF